MRFFWIFIFVIIFYSCSNNNMVTAPEKYSEKVQVNKAAVYFKNKDYLNALKASTKLNSLEGRAIYEYSTMALNSQNFVRWFFKLNDNLKIPYPETMMSEGKEGIIKISLDVKQDGTVEVTHLDLNHENSADFLNKNDFFISAKKYLETQKFIPAYDLIDDQYIDFHKTYKINYKLPNSVSIEDDSAYSDSDTELFDKVLFSSLPDILKCGEKSAVKGVISLWFHEDKAEVQTKKMCDKILLNRQNAISELDKKNDSKTVVFSSVCYPSTITDESVLSCVETVFKEKVYSHMKKNSEFIRCFIVSPELKSELFSDESKDTF